VRNLLLGEQGAARVFGPQKGADEDAIVELDDRLSRIERLQPYAELPGAGAGGGLGAAFASLGGELLDGAELVLRLTGFDERARGAALVVTGEGTVDATTFVGKAPGVVVRRCADLGVRCELFGGIVRGDFAAHALSGDPSLAAEDLVQLGEELALTL
jgi:glycerate kinase